MDFGHPDDVRSRRVNTPPKMERQERNIDVFPLVGADEVEYGLE